LALCQPPADDTISSLYSATKSLAATPANADIHPIDAYHRVKYAAGISFSDGTFAHQRQIIGLEYGTSLDPVCRLASAIEAKLEIGVKAKCIMVVDNFGGVHAPTAVGRAFLAELGAVTGMQDAEVYYHEAADDAVQLKHMKVKELCQGLPAFDVGDLTQENGGAAPAAGVDDVNVDLGLIRRAGEEPSRERAL
jgi:hypothetical protein